MPAKSKNQQQFMGMVHGLQKGEIEPEDVSKDVRDTAKSMKKTDAKDFASTKHKGLPTRVKNEIVRRLKEYGTVDDRHHAEEPNYENFPQSWMMGRGSSANEPKIYDKDRDYDDTNFRKKHSGQEDVDESGPISPQGYIPAPKKKIDNGEDKNGFVDNATSSTAWLMGREGRKFQKATYDADGTYDGENFVAKNSGQPDLEETKKMKMIKLQNILNEDDANGGFPILSFDDSLKIANTKLKQLGLQTISTFNAGWGKSYSAKPFESDLPIPKELKPFLRRIFVSSEVSADTGYDWRYNTNPNIRIVYWVSAWRFKKDDGGNYNVSLGSGNHRYNTKTKKWTDE